ncbi:MAG: hypothetical protein CMK60_04525 [Proteobacteria bacterium]|jgi:hypothetical protein|nr:hypothetical protein [Pseudomonadota bacterium]MBP09252.1 hypothetical protein [Acidiferrobacteraceae bacterium]MDP6137148.1 DUF2782 domain-containing protein [Arenicellales bacterium]HCF72656.1 hypothetical protein [Gammaproteobacteria bacterium]MDP6393195.1 DUF2782 domain-containing protein [Arenicellales bacterium]|tara:strand:- start:9 stop:320 length:312 start_codon:yes stop_codon:yes gene_type:complete
MTKIKHTVTTILTLLFLLGWSQGSAQSADDGSATGQTENIRQQAGYPVLERRILGQLRSVLVIHERGPDQVIEDRSGDGSFLDPERNLEPLSTIPLWKIFEWN